MLPDHFPIFNIDLEVDFESSDTKYPSFPANSQPKSHQKTTNPQQLHHFHNIITYSHIGRRNDNLDTISHLCGDKYTLLAVYDGHCEIGPAKYLQKTLLKRLSQHPQLLIDSETAIYEVFQETERQVIKKYQKGATALVVLVLQEYFFVANLGDSKLFGVTKQRKIQELNQVHNLGNSTQLMNVISRGGIVLRKGNQYRINGQINLSRCFGDKSFKYCMSAKPDFYRYPLNNFERLILTTDGFFNAKGHEERVKIEKMELLLDGKTVYEDNASAIYFLI